MAITNLASATRSNMTDYVDDVTVDTRELDSVSPEQETNYDNPNWTQYHGYYKEIPEVKSAIDMRAIWTVGKQWKADIRTTVVLDGIRGNGTDSFQDILKNMIIVKRVNGDAYAEIIRDEKGRLLNIKPLNPGSIRVVFGKDGMIKRYEQISKVKGQKNHIFQPNQIFHLTNKRIGDEIHGISDIEALQDIIKANYESFADLKELMHRYVKPRFIFHVDTDDTTVIDAFVLKMDTVTNKGENIYVPMGNVKPELLSVPSNATLNPLPWRQHLRDYFFQVVGIPQIILGNSGEFTESTAKIAYLAFQQSVEDEQLQIETQIWRQLYLKINLEFPASLQNEMLSDTAKDGNEGTNFQPSDMMSNMESGT